MSGCPYVHRFSFLLATPPHHSPHQADFPPADLAPSSHGPGTSLPFPGAFAMDMNGGHAQASISHMLPSVTCYSSQRESCVLWPRKVAHPCMSAASRSVPPCVAAARHSGTVPEGACAREIMKYTGRASCLQTGTHRPQRSSSMQASSGSMSPRAGPHRGGDIAS